MNLLQIILKQMRQRSLSTWLTLLSVLLGTSLAIGILILQREGQSLFAQTDFGYDLLIGPPKGSPLQLTLNTVYHLDQSPGVVPYALYVDLARKAPPLPGHPDYRQYVRQAVPFMVGDSFQGRRIVGTSPLMFGFDDDGKPVPDAKDEEGNTVSTKFQYRLGKSYELAEGHVFAAKKFEAVIGSDVAETLHLKLYDPNKTEQENQALGGAFRATHGMPKPNEKPDIHKPVWHIVGILKRTGTANDRVLFIPFISLYAIAEHEAGLAEQALARAKFDPSKIPPDRMGDALRAIGIDPERLPESVKRKYHINLSTPTTAAAKPIGDLMQDAVAAPTTASAADDGEDPDVYHLDASGNIVPDLPEEEWQISAILVKTRSGYANQQLAWNFKVIDDRATAINPAGVMREFFNTFLSGTTTVLLVISALVTVVAGASIMTTIYNSVAARLREIAIFRALGATRGRILAMITGEAALIGFLGSVAGLIVGHLLCAVGSSYMERTVGESINWTIVSRAEILYVFGVIALSFIAGLVPALKAYRTSVAENLSAS